MLSVVLQPEEPDGTVLLGVDRPADVEHVVQAFQFDRAVNTEVGQRPARHLAEQLDIHEYRALRMLELIYLQIDQEHAGATPQLKKARAELADCLGQAMTSPTDSGRTSIGAACRST